MELVKANNPILTRPCVEFDFSNPPTDPIILAQDLVKFMRDNNGIGLAAPQVGIPYKVFSIRSDPNKVLYNSCIVWYSDERIVMEEGCLSTPGLVLEIERPKHIKVRYQQPNSEIVTETFTGMTARIVQHEQNHIDGILFTYLVSRLKLERAISKANKLGFNYEGMGLYAK